MIYNLVPVFLRTMSKIRNKTPDESTNATDFGLGCLISLNGTLITTQTKLRIFWPANITAATGIKQQPKTTHRHLKFKFYTQNL